MATASSSFKNRRAHFTYIWKIKSAPSYARFKSPMFTVQLMEMTKWYLDVSILGEDVVLTVERAEEDGGPECIEVELELSFLITDRSLLMKPSVTEYFPKGRFSEDIVFLETSALFDKIGNEFFLKDELIIRCRFWRKEAEISKSELCFASTHFDVHKPSCVWAIKSFSSLQQGEKKIRILNSSEKRCPQLMLTLSLAEEDGEKCVFIHLEAPHARNRYSIQAKIAVLDDSGMANSIEHTATYLEVGKNINQLSVFELSKFISKWHVALTDDVLVLRCELHLISEVPIYNRIEDYKLMEYSDLEAVQREKSEELFYELSEASVCPFKEFVNKFKEDGTLSDVCLRAGTKSFPVHKLILSSRSPVFKAMLTQDMKEKTSKCIDIPDLDADTLDHLLLYIYEDKVEELTWEAAANLFKAADKYEILALKEMCSFLLKSNLSKSNVCEILVLADMHHDESLRKSLQEFILRNSEIMHSDVWKVFRENHSELALKTAEQIIYTNMKHLRSCIKDTNIKKK